MHNSKIKYMNDTYTKIFKWGVLRITIFCYKNSIIFICQKNISLKIYTRGLYKAETIQK